MINIVLFGPPGAGKGTQALRLIDKFGLVHISTGDVFRKNISESTELGLLAQSFMSRGELVPDQVTIDMLKDVVENSGDVKGFIFDGFPRTTTQAEALDEFLSSKSMKVDAMLALEVEDEVLVQRLLLRGQDSGRADDKDESIIRNRIKEYYNKTAILKDYFSAKNKYYGINGIGSIEEISERLNGIIANL